MNDPKDAYLELMLEEEYANEEAPDLTGRIAEALDRPAPAPPFWLRRPTAQIAASIFFFIAIISAILLVPSGGGPGPATAPPVLEILSRLSRPPAEAAMHAEQLLVDMGEEAVPHLERAIPDLGARALQIIERIRWKQAILSREQVRERLVNDRIATGTVPKSYDSPAPMLQILEERTGVPMFLGKESRRVRERAYLKLGRDSSSYTVLRDVLADFGLVLTFMDGGVYISNRTPPADKEVVATLLENLDARDLRRRATAAGMLIRITGDDFGYNPYGTREKRREGMRRMADWYKARNP